MQGPSEIGAQVACPRSQLCLRSMDYKDKIGIQDANPPPPSPAQHAPPGLGQEHCDLPDVNTPHSSGPVEPQYECTPRQRNACYLFPSEILDSGLPRGPPFWSHWSWGPGLERERVELT